HHLCRYAARDPRQVSVLHGSEDGAAARRRLRERFHVTRRRRQRLRAALFERRRSLSLTAHAVGTRFGAIEHRVCVHCVWAVAVEVETAGFRNAARIAADDDPKLSRHLQRALIEFAASGEAGAIEYAVGVQVEEDAFDLNTREGIAALLGASRREL